MNIGALYRLTKPGVTYGNLITTVAGYLFAAGGQIDWLVFAMLTVGTWAVIASACVINNYLDQDIDAVMTRTKKRPLLTGEVTPKQALILGVGLGIVGTALLVLFTNYLVAGIGVAGWIIYVWLYGAYSKRKSVHGTAVGAISGAVPILAGYVAASGVIDVGAILVFAVLLFWQGPEFYSIAIYRRKEYAAASIPLMSVVKSIKTTIWYIFACTVSFAASALLLTAYGYTSMTYSIIMGVTCAYWTWLAVQGVRTKQPEAWARRMFRYALIMLLLFTFLISIDVYLP